MFHTSLRRTGVAIVVALLGAAFVPVPASATPGLFGSQDPTYDGTYRQGLVIAGLRAVGAKAPASAVAWLAVQQCADGGFQAFRSDTSKPCTAPDPANYVGEDTNSTAAAVLAFAAVGKLDIAKRSAAYLRGTQNRDGGFPYYKGGDSDVNSTAMVLLALKAVGMPTRTLVRNDYSPVDFLITASIGCQGSANTRGALGYMPAKPNVVSDMATAQALAALSNKVPWVHRTPRTAAAKTVPVLRCPGSLSDDERALRDVVSGYIGRQLAAHNGLIPNAFGPGDDVTSSAWALIGLAGADRAGAIAARTDQAIRSATKDYVFDDKGVANAGRIGVLLLAAAARGERATAFGGVNLVSTALGTLSTS